MATFRNLILSASTQPQGSTLRTHLNNLNAGGSGTTYNIEGIYVDIDVSKETAIDVAGAEYYIEISTKDTTVDIESSPVYVDLDTDTIYIEEI